uniref:F-box domain-containing protein n=1 Tax=Macrostomum lignano TaxID=282301 RepID=A0A1I8FCI6_9PLAT
MGQILTRRQYEDLLIDGLAVAAVSKAAVEQIRPIPSSGPISRPIGIAAAKLALAILSHLGPTDLCLAACVWGHLANDELLWQALCKNAWAYCTAYSVPGRSYRQLYLRLDEASLSFNADCFDGTKFLLTSRENWPCSFTALGVLDRRQARRSRQTDGTEKLRKTSFLPNALRKFFNEVEAPNARNEYLSPAAGPVQPALCGLQPWHWTEQRRATTPISDDFLGHLYDNIYLVGHVAPTTACSY